MKEAEARPRRVNERDMTAACFRRRTRQCGGAEAPRSHTEVPAKGAGEDFVALEPDTERNIEDRIVARREPGRRLLEL